MRYLLDFSDIHQVFSLHAALFFGYYEQFPSGYIQLLLFGSDPLVS